jgi:DNA-binding transcriptional regulator LsrR (DeoR family)
MFEKQEIVIQSYREGKSQRSISRDLGLSRPTVKSMNKEFENQHRRCFFGILTMSGI